MSYSLTFNSLPNFDFLRLMNNEKIMRIDFVITPYPPAHGRLCLVKKASVAEIRTIRQQGDTVKSISNTSAAIPHVNNTDVVSANWLA